MKNVVRQIRVPLIEGLEMMNMQELDLAMEKGASKFAVCERNWPKDAPYAPDCNGSIARTKTHLAVMFHVRGLDLRATAMEDNGNSWEDSCCEFFVTDPYDGTYYNFEMTCVGSLLIIAISLNMLGVTKIKVMNFVPAIFLPILLCRFL